MKKFFNEILPFIFIALIILVCVFNVDAQPYIRSFDANRTVNVSNAAELNAAINSAQTGDQILLSDGTYSLSITMTRQNVMVKCPGHCIIIGQVKLQAINTWIWGLEVAWTGAGSFIDLAAPDTFAINNVISGSSVNGSVGISAFSQPGLRVISGNIIFHTQHLMYIQNTAPHELYVVGNTLIEPQGEPSNQRAIHEYTESPNKTENVKYIRNIVFTGQILVGGQVNATPNIGNSFDELVAYKSNTVFGYKRLDDTDITNSIYLKSTYDNQWFWGEGEVVYSPTPITFTGNKFYNLSGGKHVIITTSAYIPGRVQCSPKFRSTDTFNNNEYYGGFNSGLCANNVNDVQLAPLSLFQTKTQNAGNRFDNDSTVSASAIPDGYKLILNEYDSSSASLAVWNFSGSPTVNISLPQAASLYPAETPFGGSVVTLPSGPSALNQSAEFEAYYVKFNTGPPPPNPCDTVNQLAIDILNISLDESLTYQKRVRQMRKKDVELINALEECQE